MLARLRRLFSRSVKELDTVVISSITRRKRKNLLRSAIEDAYKRRTIARRRIAVARREIDRGGLG